MELLFDADYIVYKNCAAAETEIDFGEDVILVTSNFSDAYTATTREITKLKDEFGAFSTIKLFFSDTKNFRKKLLHLIRGIEIEKNLAGISVLLRNSRLSLK